MGVLSSIKISLMVCFIVLMPSASALEYLSDDELSKVNGFTSDKMEKTFNDQGDMVFSRKDAVDCSYYQTDQKETKIRCETDLDFERDVSLQSYLERLFMRIETAEISKPPDLTIDNKQVLDMELELKNFSYSKDLMCKKGKQSATIYLEDININNGRGGPMQIGPTTSRIDVKTVNGVKKRAIVMESEGLKGQIRIGAIKIGKNEADAKAAPSFGSLAVVFPNGMKSTIVIHE